MNNFDPTNNISWQLGHRGRVAVFIDGNNLFHAARFHNIDIDYNKLLRVLLGDGRLLRAFFYTGVDVGAERQQGFLLWMRRNVEDRAAELEKAAFNFGESPFGHSERHAAVGFVDPPRARRERRRSG